MSSALSRIETLLDKLDSGPGALPVLLNDETTGRPGARHHRQLSIAQPWIWAPW